MTLDQQLTILGYAGVMVIAAIMILLVLWIGARQSRDGRARTFWQLLHVQNLLELLATFFKR